MVWIHRPPQSNIKIPCQPTAAGPDHVARLMAQAASVSSRRLCGSVTEQIKHEQHHRLGRVRLDNSPATACSNATPSTAAQNARASRAGVVRISQRPAATLSAIARSPSTCRRSIVLPIIGASSGRRRANSIASMNITRVDPESGVRTVARTHCAGERARRPAAQLPRPGPGAHGTQLRRTAPPWSRSSRSVGSGTRRPPARCRSPTRRTGPTGQTDSARRPGQPERCSGVRDRACSTMAANSSPQPLALCVTIRIEL